MSDWDNINNSTAQRSREEGRAETIAGALGITVEECLSYKN